VASEAWHLARAGGVAIRIDVDRLPLDPAAVALLGAAEARRHAISGGEDYQLLFALPEDRLAQVAAALEPEDRPTVVGRVLELCQGGRVEIVESGRVVESDRPGYVAF
jgi:thiamine monophosphate kinase